MIYFRQLEESLELMKEDFESMEEYWQNKLDDEQKFYGEQVKTNDKQFKELENKMKEYDDELISLDMNKQDEKDKLSTIDETSSLEYQVQKNSLHFSILKSINYRSRNGRKK